MTFNHALVTLVFSLMHAFLLSRFISPRESTSPQRRISLLVLCLAAQFCARQFESAEGFFSYLYLAAIFAVSFAFILLWSALPWKASFQRALCYVLLTECLTLLLCHTSQKLLGTDVFRTGSPFSELPALALMALISGLSLRALSHFFPPETLVDANSLLISLLSAVPFLFTFRITVWVPIANESVPFSMILTLAASCLLSLTLIVSLESRLFAEKEKRQAQAMQHVMELRQQQYIMRRNSIEQVRRQYHDMKNLLLYLENRPSADNVRAHLSKMLGDIRPFESVLDTGSDVLDILLGEKLEVCQRSHIVCTIIANGALLSFIRPLDLVTLAGNAMDNAIEACMRLPDGERFIQVRTLEREGFCSLVFLNSCARDVKASGARLPTLKRDSENHGFGLANIRRVMDDYGGEMSYQAEAGEFTLTLLFPKGEAGAA